MKDQASVLRETDDDARRQARLLLRAARYAALAVLDPETGFPSASRVLLGTDIDGVPVILVSALSAHTRALSADTRSSLLVGEPGKGDPLAYPRLTVQCLAERVARETGAHARLRERFLGRHAKAKLYIDFPDFGFFRLVPQSAGLNGGFGKAYVLPGSDLAIRSPLNEAIAEYTSATVRELLALHPRMADDLATRITGKTEAGWRLCGIDTAGLDLVSGDNLLRFEFDEPIVAKEHIISHISKIAYSIP